MEADVRRWRNHPSIVMWGHSGNVFGFGGDGSPMELGRKGLSNQQEYEVRRRNGWEAIGMIKRVDPGRPSSPTSVPMLARCIRLTST
jgi:beta-galactosidase